MSVCEAIKSLVYLPVQLAIVFTVHLVLPQRQRRLTRVPVPQDLVHVVLGPNAQQLVFVTSLVLVFVAVVVLPGAMAVEALHLSADVLKVLLDAHFGEALRMLLAGLIKHLALNVDVMGPVFGFEESGLGEARSDGPDEEGGEGHHEEKNPPACL